MPTTLVRVRSQFDVYRAPAAVATPTCCCCCCLASTLTFTGFASAELFEYGRRSAAGPVRRFAMLALPGLAAISTIWLLALGSQATFGSALPRDPYGYLLQIWGATSLMGLYWAVRSGNVLTL